MNNKMQIFNVIMLLSICGFYTSLYSMELPSPRQKVEDLAYELQLATLARLAQKPVLAPDHLRGKNDGELETRVNSLQCDLEIAFKNSDIPVNSRTGVIMAAMKKASAVLKFSNK